MKVLRPASAEGGSGGRSGIDRAETPSANGALRSPATESRSAVMASMRALPTTEFSAPSAEDDDALAAVLVREAALPADAERQVDRPARRLIEAIRTTRNTFGSID